MIRLDMAVPDEPDVGCGGRPNSKTALGSGSQPTLELGMKPNRTFTELKQALSWDQSHGPSVIKGSGFWSTSVPGHGLVVHCSGHSLLFASADLASLDSMLTWFA